MKSAVLFAVAVVLSGAEPDARVLRLMTEDTQAVGGLDLTRLRGTALETQFPQRDGLRSAVQLAYKDGSWLTVLFGESDDEADSVSPSPGVRFRGDENAVRDALAAWKDAGRKLSSRAARVRELGSNYDAWVVVYEPLREEGRAGGEDAAPSTHWDRLRQSVQEVSAGIRFGGMHHVDATVKFASAEDAAAAAALAQWLPAILQRGDRGAIGLAIEAMEGLQARAVGTAVEASCRVDDGKLRKLAEKRAARPE